jgi:ElaB/YqjD/DUF883 family membrane-anchored ribosome-binding protein
VYNRILSDWIIIHRSDCVFSFQADLKERTKINGRLLMTEENKAEQTGFGMTDTNELQSARAGSEMTDAHELPSTLTSSDMTDTPELQGSRTHGQQAADDLKSAASPTAEEYSGKVEQTWGETRDHVRTFQAEADKYVRENPIKAVFTALGIGFVLGFVFRR